MPYVETYQANKVHIEILTSLFNEMCQILNADPKEVKSKCRRRDLVIIRSIYCHVARRLTIFPLRAIAKVIGGKDHSTIIHHLHKSKDMLDTNDATFKTLWSLVMQKSETVKRLKTQSDTPRNDFFTLQDMKDAFDAGVNGESMAPYFRTKFNINLQQEKILA